MPQVCTVCSHPDSHAINEALVVQGESNRAMTRRYGLSKDAIRRHREHIPELLVQASRAQEVADADLILDKLVGLEDEARVALKATKESGEWRTFLAAVAEIRENVKLLAQVSGKLKEVQVHNTQVNVLIAPQVHAAIVSALAPYPDARIAVAQALKEIEGNGQGAGTP
jgi:hypothetical protein